jgi:hypothetical protein
LYASCTEGNLPESASDAKLLQRQQNHARATRFYASLASNQAIGNSPFVTALFLLPVALASTASYTQTWL